MAEYDFSSIDVAIIDSQHHALRVLREMLGRLGFQKFETCDRYANAGALLSASTPDLVLADAESDNSEVFGFVRSLRNEPSTPNPFACVIVTTFQATPAIVMKAGNCGADDLMVKPVSPKQVLERVVTLIKERKKFVVTADFIGPDRRKSPREGLQIPLFDVPNTLRLKATGQWNPTQARQQMKQALTQIGGQKLIRTTIQAAFLVECALPGLERAPPERMALDHLGRVPAVADEVLRRLPEFSEASPLNRAACALKASAESVRARLNDGAPGGPLGRDDLADLRARAQELMRAADPERALDSMVREVANAVAGYRARLEQMAQAKAEAARAEAAKADATKA